MWTGVDLGADCTEAISETWPCNTERCPGELPDCTCSGENVLRCVSSECEKGQNCELTTFFNEDPAKNEYKCLDAFSTWCRSAGDPHITTYDGAKIDIYGQAQYLLTAS